jgi:hypothetical protein
VKGREGSIQGGIAQYKSKELLHNAARGSRRQQEIDTNTDIQTESEESKCWVRTSSQTESPLLLTGLVGKVQQKAYSTVQYSTVQCNTVQYSTAQCNAE